MNKLLNKYLREDIQKGQFGVGYIMNSLRDRQMKQGALLHQFDDKAVRLEGHINRKTDETLRALEQLPERLSPSFERLSPSSVAKRATKKVVDLPKKFFK